MEEMLGAGATKVSKLGEGRDFDESHQTGLNAQKSLVRFYEGDKSLKSRSKISLAMW